MCEIRYENMQTWQRKRLKHSLSWPCVCWTSFRKSVVVPVGSWAEVRFSAILNGRETRWSSHWLVVPEPAPYIAWGEHHMSVISDSEDLIISELLHYTMIIVIYSYPAVWLSVSWAPARFPINFKVLSIESIGLALDYISVFTPIYFPKTTSHFSLLAVTALFRVMLLNSWTALSMPILFQCLYRHPLGVI